MKFRMVTAVLISAVLFASTAWAGLTRTQVSQLYVSVFNRASEGEGNRFWQTWKPEAASTADMASTATKMLDTDVARAYFGSSLDTDQAFIEHIYKNTLNKIQEDDPEGISYWVSRLAAGDTRGRVVAALVGVIEDYAPEGIYYKADDEKTIAAYQQFVNRVAVSDYMAEKVENPPLGWETVTRFDSAGLYVTHDPAGVTIARQFIDTLAAQGPPAITVGQSEVLAVRDMSPDGDTLLVNDPGNPLHGLEISVPPGAYDAAKSFRVSSAPVTGHTFGDLFQPLTPLITVENGGDSAKETMMVQIPVQIPDGHFGAAFFYDKIRGKLDPMQLVSVDAQSIMVGTRHFSDFIVTSIPQSVLDAYLAEGIQSGFYPGVDDWSFVNRGSFIEPNGHCAGQSLGAMWYHSAKPEGNRTLWGSYDNNFRDWSTPDLWMDDSYAYRFCSVLQKDMNWRGFERTFWLEAQGRVLRFVNGQWQLQDVPAIGPEGTRNLFALAMLLTGEPQYVAIYSDSGGGHAMVVYAVTRDALHIADPNYPGDVNRTIYYADGAFDPYPSGDDWEEISAGRGKYYETILYLAKSTLMPEENIARRWQEVKNGSIGNGLFPEYEILYRDEASGTYTKLEENQVFRQDKADFLVRSVGGSQSGLTFSVYRDGVVLPFDNDWKNELVTGDNLLGFYVEGTVDGNGEYVDFRYVNVIHEKEEETQCVLEIKILPRSSDADPVISGGYFDLPLTISSAGRITYDYTHTADLPNNAGRVTRIWGTGSFDGALLVLEGAWTTQSTGGPYSGFLTQTDNGSFRLETRGFWSDPPAEATASTRRETQYGVTENNSQRPEVGVLDLTQLKQCYQ